MKSCPVTLLIDCQDDFDIIKPMLEKALDRPRIIHCKTHQDAMDYIDSDEYADIIFAEWELTGYPFIDSVRRDLENHNTPVVIMSKDIALKKIVLKSIDREATFFLAKPFLEKGLVNEFNRILKDTDRRRKNRIHPVSPVFLQIQFNEKQQYSLPLVDISIDGCLLRTPVETSWHFSVYQHVQVYLNIDEFNMQLHGEVYRIGHDRAFLDSKDNVLILIKFSNSDQQDMKVQEMVDDLGKRW